MRRKLGIKADSKFVIQPLQILYRQTKLAVKICFLENLKTQFVKGLNFKHVYPRINIF